MGHYPRKDDARQLMSQVLCALSVMHLEGFAHRDIKPQNVLLQSSPTSPQSGGWWLKLADFGIGKRVMAYGETSTMMGTPEYMAPEVLDRKKDINHPATDIWATGVMAFFLLTKSSPFESRKHRFQYEMEPNNYFPSELLDDRSVSQEGQAFVRTVLRPEPTDRPSVNAAAGLPWVHALKQAVPEIPNFSSESSTDESTDAEPEVLRSDARPDTEASGRWTTQIAPQVATGTAIQRASDAEKSEITTQKHKSPAPLTTAVEPVVGLDSSGDLAPQEQKQDYKRDDRRAIRDHDHVQASKDEGAQNYHLTPQNDGLEDASDAAHGNDSDEFYYYSPGNSYYSDRDSYYSVEHELEDRSSSSGDEHSQSRPLSRRRNPHLRSRSTEQIHGYRAQGNRAIGLGTHNRPVNDVAYSIDTTAATDGSIIPQKPLGIRNKPSRRGLLDATEQTRFDFERTPRSLQQDRNRRRKITREKRPELSDTPSDDDAAFSMTAPRSTTTGNEQFLNWQQTAAVERWIAMLPVPSRDSSAALSKSSSSPPKMYTFSKSYEDGSSRTFQAEIRTVRPQVSYDSKSTKRDSEKERDRECERERKELRERRRKEKHKAQRNLEKDAREARRAEIRQRDKELDEAKQRETEDKVRQETRELHLDPIAARLRGEQEPRYIAREERI